MITGKTKLLGVIGYPIDHSLSPVMHNAALAALDLDWVYLPWAIAPETLDVAIAGLEVLGVNGFNVTIPHKQAIMPLLQTIDPVAQAIGAVNTVYRTAAGWAGTNTDALGFLAPLRAYRPDWSDATALILGNGGAARAVVAGCAELGMAHISVVGRSLDKLTAFHQSWADATLRDRLTIHPWSELPPLLPQAALVVNTTPIGMHPHSQDCPLTEAEVRSLSGDAIAYDLIYTPRPTQFLQMAQAQGAIAIDGLEMLIHQGAAALERWIGQPAPIEVMRQALHQYLQGNF